MFPWKTVGMPVPSSSSHVLCVQRMGDCRKTNIVYTLVFFSTFEELNLPMKGPMEDSGVFGKRKEAGFPFGCADAAALDGRRGSNIYEVNPWLWQFGRGKPRLGGLPIEQTGERKDATNDARHKRAAETKQARKTA